MTPTRLSTIRASKRVFAQEGDPNTSTVIDAKSWRGRGNHQAGRGA